MREMKIETTRVRAGRYVIRREDGLEVEAVRGVGHWWVSGGIQRPTLAVIKLDLRMGYSPWPRRDEPQSEGERAWRTAMGMGGYAGSPTEREDRKAHSGR